MNRCITVMSFGYKNGTPPTADLVFNVRFIENPYHAAGLRDLDGRHPDVTTFVMRQECVQRYLAPLSAALRASLAEFLMRGGDNFEEIKIAFGCAGGRQRSVVMSLWCAEIIRDFIGSDSRYSDIALHIRHRDLSL